MSDPISLWGIQKITPPSVPIKKTNSIEYTRILKQLRILSNRSLNKQPPSPKKEKLKKTCPIRKNELLESLLDLSDHCLKNKKKDYRKCFKFLFYLVEEKEAEKTVGKWLYIIDQEPRSVKKALLSSDPEMNLSMLEKLFTSTFKKRKKRLTKIYKQPSERNFIPSSLAIREQIPLFIANALITSTGKVNYGLIPHLRCTFLRKGKEQQNFSINIDSFLKTLHSSKEVRSMIEHLEPPKVKTSPINVILRATLRKFDLSPLSKREVQTAAMSALLSHPRQGLEGNCFSQYLANILLVTNPKKCLHDFESLINQSCLIREVNGEVHILPFLLKPTNEFIQNSVQLKNNGKWRQKNGNTQYLWLTDPFLSAAKALQIEDPEKAYKEIVKERCKLGPIKIQVSDLLTDLAKYAYDAQEKKEELALLTSQAFLAFSSYSSNPLQSIWINAIANGAESHISGKLKKFVTETISNVLHECSKESDELTQKLVQEVDRQMEEGLRLYYDGSLSTSSHAGGFVLYLIHRKKKMKIRIDSPELFQEMVMAFLDSAKHQLQKEKKFSLRLNRQLKNRVKTVGKYIQSKLFLVDATTYYQEISPFQYGDPKQYEKLRCTPWVNLAIGHDAAHILKVYFEMDELPECNMIRPKNGEELLFELLSYRSEISENIQGSLESNSYFLTPTRIVDQHAFSLMLNHQTFTDVFDLSKKARALALDNMGKQATVMRTFSPSLEYQKKVLNWLAFHVSDKKHPDKQINFHLTPSGSLSQFRSELTRMISALLPLSEQDQEALFIQVDQILWDLLPIQMKKAYGAQFIHIADTNWRASDGVEDIRYAIGTNPFNEKLELFEIRDTGEGLRFLLQERYFGTSWELYRNPEQFLEAKRKLKKAPSFELNLLRTGNL